MQIHMWAIFISFLRVGHLRAVWSICNTTTFYLVDGPATIAAAGIPPSRAAAALGPWLL